MAVDFAIFQKSRHEGCKLVFGEVIAIIDKDALIRQSKNGLRIGNEHIGQLRRPWLSRRCGNDAVVDVLVVRHHGDLNLDALFDANRVVENIDEIVERRIRLATVDVPDGDGGRLVALRADAAGTALGYAGMFRRILGLVRKYEVLSVVWPKLGKFLRRIRPRKIAGRIVFGLDDPAATGKLTGGIAMVPLFYETELVISPDFETDETYIRGTVTVRGHILLLHALILVVGLAREKRIRAFIGAVRKGK